MSDRTHELFNLFVFDIKQQQIYSIKQEHSTHINQETELIVIENINMKERTNKGSYCAFNIEKSTYDSSYRNFCR